MGVRIAVLGNCQVPGIAEVLNCIVPDARAEGIRVSGLRAQDRGIERCFDSLCNYDVVLLQPLGHSWLGPLRFDELQKSHPHVVAFPPIVFSGYHPDFFGAGENAPSAPGGAYHSLIAAAAYVRGIPAKEARALLNPLVFAKLGYFKEFGLSKSYLLQKGRELGYELEDEFERWTVDGPFMYTGNHPAIRVLATIAGKAAERAQLRTMPERAGEARDQLKKEIILPVYPPIARRLGLSGGDFRVDWVARNKMVLMDRFIAARYDAYASLPKSFFEDPKIKRAAELIAD